MESLQSGASERERIPDSDLIIVGVGASAGGLEAFTELLLNLPSSTGLAYILVQHLDPHHESALPELLAAKAVIPVTQAENNTRIQRDHIYVIPPNGSILVRNQHLILETRPAAPEQFRPIDTLFQSLAQDSHENAVGVVLSGTASDGTIGLKAIKAEGGITFAQDETAKFDSMPRSAIAAGAVDYVLPPSRIAQELSALSRSSTSLRRTESEKASDSSTLHQLLSALRNRTGVDFTQYKQATVLRRLKRRMMMRQAENLERYFELLQNDSDEVKFLFDDLLINVTDFFRDPDVFEAYSRVALPFLIHDRKEPVNIRAWVPGCASGEEVYSLAIATVEYLESEGLDFTVQMFGTDVSDRAIEKARAGVFDESAVLNISPERLRRFFLRTESGYQISRGIREMCIFSRHNIAKDPPLSHMDLISCRNLLIYFEAPLQRRIIATFGYGLQPRGCLLLGSSETLGSLAEYFQTLDERHRIYARKSHIPQNVFEVFETTGDYMPRGASVPAAAQTTASAQQVHQYVNRIVLSRYGPAGIVANEFLRVVEYRGDTAQYVVEQGSQPDAELMTAVRQELRAGLGRSIEQARRTSLAAVVETHSVVITVVPFVISGSAAHFLILFAGQVVVEPTPSTDETEATHDPEKSRLRHELKATREYLQSVIEELRATNEEAQSANEELQSTNEELQTAKEELQASNEELNTINAEIQSRNADLARLTDDLINLLSSMNTPIVMTGTDLRIRRFTPIAEKALRLIPADVGRPIADLKPRINVPNLEEILQHVLETLHPHEQEVEDQEGRQYLMRVRPYRTEDNRIDGTVLQLVDVTDLKRGLEEAKYARDYSEAIVNTIREPLVVLDQNLTIQNANRAFYEVFGLTSTSTLGENIHQATGGQFDVPAVRGFLERLTTRSPQLNDIEITYQPERSETRILSLNARRLAAPDGQQLTLMAFEDITERKRAAEARYRRLFESAWDMIVLVDADTGEVMDLNPFTERHLGYSRDDLVGRKLWELDAITDRARVRSAFEQVRNKGVLRFNELNLRPKGGSELQAEVIASLYSEGNRRAIQFNVRDVSERKKFERELQETQKLESLGLLAGGIAHDFNNLLTGIIGNASFAYSELPVNQPLRARLREVIRAGERAAFLTRQMLAYAGKGHFISEKIDLGGLISEISSLITTSIPKGVELRLDSAPNLPPVEGDVSQLQQVIMNLVINGAEAISGNERGIVEVRTSLRELDEREAAEFFGGEKAAAGTYVQLEVSDNGSGMDDATRARIFDPFFTTKFTGRGLGLAAVQGIVKAHSGAIRVQSAPGHGTSFLVLLPARTPKATPAAPPREEDIESIPSGSTVLVIDDEENIRELAEKVLSRAGARVLTAENGKNGVDIFRQHHSIISVVLLDLMMPVMGGDEALSLIKEINGNVPLVLSSGFDEPEAARRFAEPNPAGFLQKPYTAQRLKQAIAAALNRKKV